MRISSRAGRAMAVALGVLAFTVGTADAKKSKPPKSKPDAALICVSTKHKEAGKYCSAVLKAWSQFEKSGKADKRDASIAKAKQKLTTAWSKAEDKGTGAGVECGGAFLAASTAGAFIDSASGAMVDVVNTGLTLSDKTQAKCGSKIVSAAARSARRC
jgi:hypothetical protein